MKSSIVIAALIGVMFAVPSYGQDSKPNKAEMVAIAMTPEQISALIAIKDDPLEKYTWLTSAPVLKSRQNSDKYLRAAFDKKTGDVTYQLYLSVVYSGRNWIMLDRLNFQTADGPESADLVRVFSDVNCARAGCTFYEDAIATIPRAALDWAAQGAQGGVDAQWFMKVYGRNIEIEKTGLLKTEIAGFLMAVDRYRDEARRPRATAPSPHPLDD